MNIVHIVPIFQKSSGVATFVGEVSNLQVQAGHSVTVATLPTYQADHYPVQDGVAVVSIQQVLTCSHDVTHLHLHGIWTPILHTVVKWACGNDVPIIWSPHGMLAPWAMAHKKWKKWPVWHLWQRRDLTRAAVLHATTELEAQWIRDLRFENPIEVIPLGTHIPVNLGSGNLSARSPRDTRTLLFVGRVYPVKGLRNLILAWAKVDLAVRKGWKIRIVGPDQAGHTAELQELCRQLNVEADVEFIGPRYGSELEIEYAGADCLVLPSFTENFGGVVVDALARGVPVIASTFTPWQELENADTGRCGWWVSNDPNPLAVALTEMMSLTDEDRRALGKRGRLLVQGKYTWSAVMDRLNQVYDMI